MSSNVIEGFVLTMGNKMYIKETTRVNKSNVLAKEFVDAVCDTLCLPDDTRTKFKTVPECLATIKSRMDRAVVEKVDTGKVVYYKITGKNFTECIPLAESECLVFVGRDRL